MNLKDNPVVSVLTTCFNRENYIAAAMESILSSTYHNFELIVVDDCSDDDSVKIAEEISRKDDRVRVFKNEKNIGDYPNRNKAASYAKGKYIKYLDSDDIMYPHCLSVMVNAMESYPDAGYGLSAAGYESGAMPLLKDCKQSYLEHFGSKKHFDRAPGSSIIRKEAFEKVGGFSGKRMIGDFELWLKLSCYYPLVVFQRDLVWDRTHEGQERQSDYALQYNKLRNEILYNALRDKNCPLSKSEIQRIDKIQQKESLKQKVKGLLRIF